MEKKLEVKNLVVSFRTSNGYVRAVRDVSFDLYKGETLCIVGESGSGKSVTSKAIIGILSGNSIVEGGEILYDGQDLLKIQEEDFHKIRGNKIAMIFQDPLSALDPIVRVGDQLTEAMILNGKARQKNARNDFNTRLKLLNENMDEVHADQAKFNKEQCDIFNQFCIASTKLELNYNNANNDAIALHTNIENIIFLLEKKAPTDYMKEFRAVKTLLPKTVHLYCVHEDEGVAECLEEIDSIIKAGPKNLDFDGAIATLKKIFSMLEVGIARKAPNFFRLGYLMYKDPNYVDDGADVDALDAHALEVLMNEYMNQFLIIAEEGLRNSHNKSIEAKKALLAKKDEIIEFFSKENLDKKETMQKAKEFSAEVNAAIDRLDILKFSAEYAFAATLKNYLNRYFNALVDNPRAINKNLRMQAKYDALVAQDKRPTWKVIPPLIVDTDLQRKNITKAFNDLFSYYEKTIADSESIDWAKTTVAFIDHMKERASRVVYKVTKQLATAKALDLMKEVGIPEPAIRFKQYPFEFSGGMRQRIVIAIALSANPDILICDEPTTALDVTIQAQILELINKIKKERNLSVIFITHNLGVVANMADRVAVMYAGKIVEYGTSEDVFYDSKHPYTWALLASMPDLETKETLDAIPGTPPNMIYPPKGDAFADRNKYALDIDFEMQPPMFKVNETHYAATWLLHPNAPQVNPPKIIGERIARMKEANKDE